MADTDVPSTSEVESHVRSSLEKISTLQAHSHEHRGAPHGKTQFLERLRTFSSQKWFARRGSWSPINCSLWGWRCCDVNTLSCSFCGAVKSVPSSQGEGGTDAAANLRAWHRESCAFRQSSCPETVVRLSAGRAAAMEAQMRAKTFALSGNHPVRVVRSVDAEAEADAADDALVLACCGWNLTIHSGLVIIECSYCGRRVGTWHRPEGIDAVDEHRPYCAYRREWPRVLAATVGPVRAAALSKGIQGLCSTSQSDLVKENENWTPEKMRILLRKVHEVTSLAEIPCRSLPDALIRGEDRSARKRRRQARFPGAEAAENLLQEAASLDAAALHPDRQQNKSAVAASADEKEESM